MTSRFSAVAGSRRRTIDVPPPEPATTKFGFWAGTTAPGAGGTARANYDRVKGYLGTPDVYRMFYPGQPPATFANSNADFGPPVVVSFKGSPAAVIRGDYDARLTSWFNSIPADRKVWWSYFHEPENDIHKDGSFTAAQYRAAWTRILSLAPQRANLIPTLILMEFTLSQPSRMPIEQYVVPGLEVLAWDAYLTGGSLANVFGPVQAKSAELGLRFGVGETSVLSSYNLSGRTHTQTVTDHVEQTLELDADFVCWFESNKSDGDWRMLPYAPAVAAWVAGT